MVGRGVHQVGGNRAHLHAGDGFNDDKITDLEVIHIGGEII